MEKIVHNPSQITVGKMYRTVSNAYRDSVIYLGCINNNTREKFLVIVEYDKNADYVGKTVIFDADDTRSSLWTLGFQITNNS